MLKKMMVGFCIPLVTACVTPESGFVYNMSVTIPSNEPGAGGEDALVTYDRTDVSQSFLENYWARCLLVPAEPFGIKFLVREGSGIKTIKFEHGIRGVDALKVVSDPVILAEKLPSRGSEVRQSETDPEYVEVTPILGDEVFMAPTEIIGFNLEVLEFANQIVVTYLVEPVVGTTLAPTGDIPNEGVVELVLTVESNDGDILTKTTPKMYADNGRRIPQNGNDPRLNCQNAME